MLLSSALPRTQAGDSVELPRKGRFIHNLAANLINFGLNIGVGLWMIPYLIGHLGVGAYGLVPLAVNVTAYMGLFTTALHAAVGRFATFAMDRQDYSEANRVFNTAFWGTAAILLILLGPGLWLSSQARFFFNVPVGYEDQVGGLFLCTMAMFFLTALSFPFGIATFCRNRFDLTNIIRIAGTFIRAAAILLFFNLWVPGVWQVGTSMVVSASAMLVLSVVVCRHLTPMLQVRYSAFSRHSLGQLFGMGWWVMINMLGNLLFLSIDLVVVNKMIGSEAGGQYGAVMIWSANLRNLAGVVAGVFEPSIISLYGLQDMSELVAYTRRAVKFLGLMMALPIGLICGFAQPLLHVWLGPAFEPLAPLMIVMCLHLCLNLPVIPLFNIQIATNHVRLPGILTCVTGLGNLGLAIVLAGPVGWGMYGVAVAGAIMLTAQNLVFTPLYAAYVLNLGYRTFYSEILPVVTTTIGLAGTGWLLSRSLQLQTWLGLGLTGLGLAGAFILISYRFLLTNEERRQAWHLIWPRGAIATP